MHRFARRLEKGVPGVCHQMPAIGDLDRMRQRRGGRQRIGAASVAGDAGDLGLVAEPGLCGGRLPIGQQADGSSPLKIADARAIAVSAPPGAIIDANDRGALNGRAAVPSHRAE
jgi:hypothetical protein